MGSSKSDLISAAAGFAGEDPLSYLRSSLVMASTALVMLIADYAITYATLRSFASGSTLVIAAAPIIGFLMLAAAVVAVCKLVAKRYEILGALVVTALFAWAGIYSLFDDFLGGGSLEAYVSRHLALCGLSAVSLGLFLGPWPFRIAGAAAAAGLIALVVYT